MAKKFKDTPITSSDVKEYLATRDDFAMELEVYRLAVAQGFTATHGGTYTDPITQKPRQYDVRAEIDVGNMRLKLAIECKNLGAEYPLVVSRVPRTAHESQMSYIVPATRHAMMAHLPPAEQLTLSPHKLYPEREGVGRSMTQVGRIAQNEELMGGDPDVYDKWTQALASASDLIGDAVHSKSTAATAVLPVLVVSDGTLWVADYDADGALKGEPEQANECSYFVGREYNSSMGFWFTVSHFHICTLTGLWKFLYQLIHEARLFTREDLKAAYLRDRARASIDP